MELRVFVEPQEGATYAEQLAVAQAAERQGYGAFFRSDHLVAIDAQDGLPGPTDSWVTLGAIARETSSIRLGTLVSSATFRLPGHLAVQVAQVDEMSAGRVELGLGAGWFEREHLAYGIPFPAVAERFDRLEEQLAIISGLWSTAPHERFSYAGRHYQLSDCPPLPKPVQTPAPPIIVGGTGLRRTPMLAAMFANEINVFDTPEQAAKQFGRVDDACAAIGRDPAEIKRSIATMICCATSKAELTRRAERIGKDLTELREQTAGTPAEVIERLEQYRAAGAERSYLQFLDMQDLDHIALVASEVMPHLRRPS